MNPIAILVVILYVVLCYSTANYHYKKRSFDLFWGTVICVFLSPFIGGIILSFFKEKAIQPKTEPKKIYQAPTSKPAATSNPVAKPAKPLIPKINFSFNKNILKYMIGILTVFLVIMIMGNPSYNKFKEFTPDVTTKKHYALRKRVTNYLIYSVYEIQRFDLDDYDEFQSTTQRYIGFMMNFYVKK